MTDLYCLTCKMDMCSIIEAADHIVNFGCIVESLPKDKEQAA